jgi:threonine dehydratase
MNEHRLRLDAIEEAVGVIDPVFLNSPQFVCESLGEMLGVTLLLKIETLNPIRSFKGRGADLLVTRMDKTDKRLMCASAGNFGQAMAYACRKHGVHLTVYASLNANPHKLERMRALGADVILHGADFDTAKLEAKRVASEKGIRFVEDSLDIETLEGAGTMALELLCFPLELDALLIPLGNGALFNGIARVFKARHPQTRLIAVQAAGAAAMVESLLMGEVIAHDQVQTIADGIAVRLPVPQALADMHGLVDDTLLVCEESILGGMQLLHRHGGVVVEPSAAVGIAALMENPSLLRGKRVATIVTGGNLTIEQMQTWLCAIPKA